jgi:hypothetical protein
MTKPKLNALEAEELAIAEARRISQARKDWRFVPGDFPPPSPHEVFTSGRMPDWVIEDRGWGR